MMSLYSDTDWDRLGVATATWFSLPRDQTGWPEGTDPLLDLTVVVDVRELDSLRERLRPRANVEDNMTRALTVVECEDKYEEKYFWPLLFWQLSRKIGGVDPA